MSDNASHNKFINPFCSINVEGNSSMTDKQEFYNCLVRDEWQLNKWTCYGPYLNHEDATALKGLSEIPKHNKSMLVPVSSYLPHKIDIMNTLVRYTFPQVVIKSQINHNNQDALHKK
jgi:hypothetical protein